MATSSAGQHLPYTQNPDPSAPLPLCRPALTKTRLFPHPAPPATNLSLTRPPSPQAARADAPPPLPTHAPPRYPPKVTAATLLPAPIHIVRTPSVDALLRQIWAAGSSDSPASPRAEREGDQRVDGPNREAGRLEREGDELLVGQGDRQHPDDQQTEQLPHEPAPSQVAHRGAQQGLNGSTGSMGGDRVCEGGAIEMSSGQRTIEVGADESAHHYI